MAKVSIRNVWKKYGETAAVKDLNIDCADGVVPVDPWALGLRQVLDHADGRRARAHLGRRHLFDEQRINDLAPKDRDVAMVFENYALYPHKTVFENMANPLKLRGQDAATIKRTRDHGREAARDRRFAAIAGRRNCPAARSSASPSAAPSCASPSCSCSTSRSRISMPNCAPTCAARSSIMQRTLGTTMIYVTHDQLEAMSMADTIAVMHEGELQQLGTPARGLQQAGQRLGRGLRRRAGDELPRLRH